MASVLRYYCVLNGPWLAYSGQLGQYFCNINSTSAGTEKILFNSCKWIGLQIKELIITNNYIAYSVVDLVPVIMSSKIIIILKILPILVPPL